MFDLANQGLLTPQGCAAPRAILVISQKKGLWLNAVDFTDLKDEASDPAAPHHPRRRRSASSDSHVSHNTFTIPDGEDTLTSFLFRPLQAAFKQL